MRAQIQHGKPCTFLLGKFPWDKKSGDLSNKVRSSTREYPPTPTDKHFDEIVKWVIKN
jgi:hypothetical protein